MYVSYLLNNCKYTNAPEGQRPFEKVFGLSKYGLLAGIGAGVYDSVLISRTYNLWTTVNCFSYWIIPATAMCATFASVAYTTTRLRGQDGYINYILAALATGGVFYHWQKNGPLAYQVTTLLIGGTLLKKHGDLNGVNHFRIFDLKLTKSNITFPWDLTIVKDPRGPQPWE